MAIAEYLEPEDYNEASEGYIRYCTGIAIVQFPEDMVDIHRRQDIESSADEILAVAERLMIDGIIRVIRTSQEPDFRKHKLEMESRFKKALPAMRELVEHACFHHEARLEKLSPMYPVLRPAPFLHEPLYRKICHGNYTTLKTIRLMDVFMPDPILLDKVGGRTVKGYNDITDEQDDSID